MLPMLVICMVSARFPSQILLVTKNSVELSLEKYFNFFVKTKLLELELYQTPLNRFFKLTLSWLEIAILLNNT
jgi:hypothetical protein